MDVRIDINLSRLQPLSINTIYWDIKTIKLNIKDNMVRIKFITIRRNISNTI